MGPTISTLVYKLNIDQNKRLIGLLEEFDSEGIDEGGYGEEHNTSLEYMINYAKNHIKYEERQKLVQDAFEKGISLVPKEDYGVHETHCCLDHGCEYGDLDCPVTMKLTKQVYKCELCKDEENGL